MNTHEPTGSFDFSLPGQVNSGMELGAGVASLDSPLVQQTKSEIRALAAEIAEFAHSPISEGEFYGGFLPRLCVAMGASSAGVWKVGLPTSVTLQASHLLPPQLVNDQLPSEAHASVLQCVIAEGQPILVPPSNVTIDAQRPSNPLSEALVIVPVRIQESIEYVLEVVQRQSGGPAAQRGYLRFVAQMADLMADFLRRQQLRGIAAKEQRLNLIEDSLLRVASSPQSKARVTAAADALNELLGAETTIIAQGQSRPTVHAVSGTNTPDPRSEVVLAATELTRRWYADGDRLAWWHATDRRDKSDGTQAAREAENTNDVQTSVNTLCDSLRCRRLLGLVVDESSETVALVAYADSCPLPEQQEPTWETDTRRLGRSIGTLLAPALRSNPPWRAWLPFPSQAARSRADLVRRWIARVALCGLVFAIALFPVPLQVSAIATLQAVDRQVCYAATAGEVKTVYVNTGDRVGRGDVMIELTTPELDKEIDRLTGELDLIRTELNTVEKTLASGESGSRDDNLRKDLLEEKKRMAEDTIKRLTEDRDTQQRIVALADGIVSTRKLNNLKGKQVQVGESLATVVKSNTRWELQLRIPDFRAGMVQQSIDANGYVRVRFSLNSHSDQHHDAQLIKLASHVEAPVVGSESDTRVILAAAAVATPEDLPMKKDGALGRATIECGRVPAIWLVFRDAYHAVSSRVQMIW